MDNKRYAIADELTATDIKALRGKLKLTQAEFAQLVNVSRKTVERWEASEKQITGPIVTLVKVLNNNPDIKDDLEILPKEYPVRLWYMCGNELCTLIDVDEPNKRVKIRNYTNDYILRAFGREDNPTFEEYEEFLESRCFPRSRDKMKLILKDLDLPFYDPFMIIEKTEGRMAEDNFSIRIEKD